MGRKACLQGVVCLLAAVAAYSSEYSTPDDSDRLQAFRVTGEIKIDGDLSDGAWRDVPGVEVWYETRPGDNVPPAVKNVGYLAYDDEFFYAAFEFEDPQPEKIRAPLSNRDDVPSYTDYGGVLVDATNDRKTAQMFLANARGIQYDAISSDASGEDSAPDFFWDSAARVTAEGWVLEMRIPFSSLRYSGEEWRIMLYRNYPRDFRTQMFTSRLPRDSNCFICNAKPLDGLESLPSGGHWVIAPYASGQQSAEPRDGLGTPLESGSVDGELGLDAKWLPSPNTIIDATLNPDFSQIESDVAQISANERFALFFPEKRPFFLEGIDLFSTPIRAVYTRTFTSPRWGTRATGKVGKSTYMLLAGQDRGGGSVILPGSNSSDFAEQDFESTVTIGRWRRDIGDSFVSMIYSGREIDGGGSNRLFGPDFRWQPNERNTISGQFLFSRSETPDRPDLADEWDGRELSDHAAELWWWYSNETWDTFLLYEDIGNEFRADNGFVPQVGYRQGYGELGYTLWPEEKPVSRVRFFLETEYSEMRGGGLLSRGVTPGFGMDGKWSSFFRTELAFEEQLAIDETFETTQLRNFLFFTPSRRLSRIGIETNFGDSIDFANDRVGDGANISLSADIRPTDRLQLRLNADRRWIDVDTDEGLSGRLFTAEVARLRAIYTFNSRSWMRLIGQWAGVERRPDLYTFEVDDESGSLSGSLVFAYKLNWQTALFVGVAESQELDELDNLESAGRELFLKVSYAFQG